MPILRDGGLKGVIGGDVAMDSVIANVKAIHPTPANFRLRRQCGRQDCCASG